MNATYVGRFAPSPSGPLHLGSLYIAVASYLAAKAQSGTWIVRIEDIDEPRSQIGADQLILDTLTAHGLHSDVPIVYQSRRKLLYENYLNRLQQKHKTYPCQCTRAAIKAVSPFYQGQCRQAKIQDDKVVALRYLNNFQISADSPVTSIDDEDIIIRRKDGLFAYNFVVVCDDIEQGVSQIIRGNDLLDTTQIQSILRQEFNYSPLDFIHLPVLVSSPGQKLSKQNHAPAVDNEQAKQNLLRVFSLLGIHLASALREQNIPELLYTGVKAWPERIINKQHEIIVR